jgi:hypothetical protein
MESILRCTASVEKPFSLLTRRSKGNGFLVIFLLSIFGIIIKSCNEHGSRIHEEKGYGERAAQVCHSDCAF